MDSEVDESDTGLETRGPVLEQVYQELGSRGTVHGPSR